ncbi:MAG: family 78 glycoside hydrolase catalytic domain [Clostridia bacterium]|nr:family 78 glycoside hydrolase catalytic domain [Clostridia bacterium]
MNSHKFKGKWITNSDFALLEPINVFHRYLEKPDFEESKHKNKHILFRRKFTLQSTEDTKIYISADDYFKLYINGNFVGCGPKSSYVHNYCFNEFDISSYVREGENLLAVHTYYQGLINRVFVSGDNRHGLVCDIMQKGDTVLSSDESFLCSYHSGYKALDVIGYDTQFTESYNTNAKERDFYKEDFDDSCWENAVLKDNPDYTLKAQPEKNLVFEKIAPVSLRKTDFGYFIDFGKNFVGYLKFTASGKQNDTIRIRYGQELQENGRVQYKMRANCNYEDEMILSGGTDKANFFDYKAFRYAEIVTEDEPQITDIYLLARHYPFELKVTLKTYDKNIRKIFELCVHTLKYGVQETVMDCPDREKGCYLGDGCYLALTHGVLTKDYSLFRELIKDALESSFISPSLVTCLNCSLVQEIAEFPLIMVYCLEIYLKLSGDRAFTHSVLPKLKAVTDYYKEHYTNSDGLICRTDKWCVAEWPDSFRDGYDVGLSQSKEITATHAVINAYYYKALCSFNFLSGKAVYDTEKLKTEFNKAFYVSDDKRFKDSTESTHQSFIANLFSLAFGLCDEKAEKEILSLFKEKGISSVNIFGAFPMLWYLYEKGYKDILKRQILNEKAWLRMINEGATTTFECWGKDLKWNTSLFHLTLSYVALFFADDIF